MRDRTSELRQGLDSSDDEDTERVALVLNSGTAGLGNPDDVFFQKVSLGFLVWIHEATEGKGIKSSKI